MRLFQALILLLLVMLPLASALAAAEPAGRPARHRLNSSDLSLVPAEYTPPAAERRLSLSQAPAIVKLQILLDRAGASPGVIDGFDGDNVRKAVRAFEAMAGLPVDGKIGADAARQARKRTAPVIGSYTITDKDVAGIVPAHPHRLRRNGQAQIPRLRQRHRGARPSASTWTRTCSRRSIPTRSLSPASTVAVAAYGPDKEGKVATHRGRQERPAGPRLRCGWQTARRLSGDHRQRRTTRRRPAPIWSTRSRRCPTTPTTPTVNFKQGNNTEKLIIPPGPNGPVGAMWIDLTEPTFGIHGTPEPEQDRQDQLAWLRPPDQLGRRASCRRWSRRACRSSSSTEGEAHEQRHVAVNLPGSPSHDTGAGRSAHPPVPARKGIPGFEPSRSGPVGGLKQGSGLHPDVMLFAMGTAHAADGPPGITTPMVFAPFNPGAPACSPPRGSPAPSAMCRRTTASSSRASTTALASPPRIAASPISVCWPTATPRKAAAEIHSLRAAKVGAMVATSSEPGGRAAQPPAGHLVGRLRRHHRAAAGDAAAQRAAIRRPARCWPTRPSTTSRPSSAATPRSCS